MPQHDKRSRGGVMNFCLQYRTRTKLRFKWKKFGEKKMII